MNYNVMIYVRTSVINKMFSDGCLEQCLPVNTQYLHQKQSKVNDFMSDFLELEVMHEICLYNSFFVGSVVLYYSQLFCLL